MYSNVSRTHNNIIVMCHQTTKGFKFSRPQTTSAPASSFVHSFTGVSVCCRIAVVEPCFSTDGCHCSQLSLVKVTMAAAKVVSEANTSANGVEIDRSDTDSPTPVEADEVKSASRKSLKDRSKIPTSFYITVIGYLGIAYYGNVFRIETLQSWIASMLSSTDKFQESLVYSQQVAQTLVTGEYRPLSEYLQVSFITLSVLSLLYIFVWAPLRAGFWTGSRATRHVIHRYMGLAYMAQYFLAWFEFATNYEEKGKDSFLPMFIALNGK